MTASGAIPEPLRNHSRIVPERFRNHSVSRARSSRSREQGALGAGEQGSRENPSDSSACLPAGPYRANRGTRPAAAARHRLASSRQAGIG